MIMTLIAVVAVIGLAAAFMGTVDQSGLVTIEAAKGTAGGRAAIEAKIVPTPTQFSYGSLVRSALDALEGNAFVVVDTVNRKVYFTDHANDGVDLINAATNSGAAKSVNFSPDADQTGRSLTWSSSVNNTPTNGDAYEALVAEVKPRLSVESLVTRIIGAMDGESSIPPKLVAVDQLSGQVWAIETDRTTQVAAASLSNGNAGVLTLSEPEVAGTAAALVFEGGSTNLD